MCVSEALNHLLKCKENCNVCRIAAQSFVVSASPPIVLSGLIFDDVQLCRYLELFSGANDGKL
jgi:hypothetical protein